jgi:hypothetical protein
MSCKTCQTICCGLCDAQNNFTDYQIGKHIIILSRLSQQQINQMVGKIIQSNHTVPCLNTIDSDAMVVKIPAHIYVGVRDKLIDYRMYPTHKFISTNQSGLFVKKSQKHICVCDIKFHQITESENQIIQNYCNQIREKSNLIIKQITDSYEGKIPKSSESDFELI